MGVTRDWKKLAYPAKDLDLLKCARSILEDAYGDDRGPYDLNAEIESLAQFVKRRAAQARARPGTGANSSDGFPRDRRGPGRGRPTQAGQREAGGVPLGVPEARGAART